MSWWASSPTRRDRKAGTATWPSRRRNCRSKPCSTTRPPCGRGNARKPGGALACFAGGAEADKLFALSDEEIVARFTADLLKLYPELEGKIGEGILRRHPRVVPYWAPGGRASLATLRENFGPIYLAGDYQLDMPSLADAADSGQQAGEKVLASLPPRAD